VNGPGALLPKNIFIEKGYVVGDIDKFGKKIIRILMTLLIACSLSGYSPALASPIGKGIEKMSKDLVKGIIKSGRKRVGVLEFTTITKKKTDFGKLISEKLSTELTSMAGNNFRLIERSQVDKFLGENPFLTAQEASEILKADVIITGTYALVGRNADINARAIDTADALALATAECVVNIEGYKALLGPEALNGKLKEEREKRPISLTAQILAARWIDGQMVEMVVKEGDTLFSNERFRINFRLNHDSYLYILLFSSQEEASILFPNPKIALDNYIRGNVPYSLPGEGLWFFLDDHPGIESLYFVASYEPMNDIAKLLSTINTTADSKRKHLSNKIIKTMGVRGIGGITANTLPNAGVFAKSSERKDTVQLIKGKGSLLWQIDINHK